jgi:hypothetical protein
MLTLAALVTAVAGVLMSRSLSCDPAGENGPNRSFVLVKLNGVCWRVHGWKDGRMADEFQLVWTSAVEDDHMWMEGYPAEITSTG